MDVAPVLRVARRQHGIVTITDLVAASASPLWIRTQLNNGGLEIVHQNVFRIGGWPLDWQAQAFAALAAAGSRAALCRFTAARALGMDVSVPASKTIQIVLPNSAPRRRLQGVRTHRSRSLPPTDVVKVGTLRTTTAPRTLIDLSHLLAPEPLAAILDDALARRLITASRLERQLEAMETRGRVGTRELRRLLAAWKAGPIESVPEARAFRLLRRTGLPDPSPQHVVRDESGAFVARLDFAWPDQLVALEIDGFRWHSAPAQLAADRRRQNMLVQRGWQIVRTTPLDLSRDGAADAIAALMALLRPA